MTEARLPNEELRKLSMLDMQYALIDAYNKAYDAYEKIENKGGQEVIEGKEELTFAEKLQKVEDEAFNKWFERWYRNMNIERKLMQSAQKGYKEYAIEVSYLGDDEKLQYIARRLRDNRTIPKLLEKLGEVSIKRYRKAKKDIFGRTTYEDYIMIKTR